MIITVHGLPAPQGSKRYVGHGIMIESSKHVKPWREAVKHAALLARPAAADDGIIYHGPVDLDITFCFLRPKSHYGTGRNAHILKESAAVSVIRKPDLSKLIRSTEDALTDALIWRDDSQVVHITASKRYADMQGATIRVTLTHTPHPSEERKAA